MTPKVNFLCVGAQKAGTSSLHDILKQHSDVCLALNKETHFFDENENFKKGIDWYYNSFFNHYSGEAICGECTPEYMYFEDVPEKLYHAFGADIKIVFLLRNPVNRGFSHFIMSKKRLYETYSFEEAIKLEEDRIKKDYFHKSHFSYLSRGFYSEQINRFLKYFPKENMLFIRFEEDFVKNREKTINQLCSFLGISAEHLNVDIKSNVGKEPRYKWIPKFIYKPNTMKQLLSFMPPKFRSKIIKLGYGFAMKDNASEKLPKELKAKLLITYENEIERLQALINKDLSSWKT